MDDELPAVRPCLMASVDDAESKNLYEYGLLSPHFYYIIQNGEINTCVDRYFYTFTKVWIRKVLTKMHVLVPRAEYYCAPVASGPNA